MLLLQQTHVTEHLGHHWPVDTDTPEAHETLLSQQGYTPTITTTIVEHYP